MCLPQPPGSAEHAVRPIYAVAHHLPCARAAAITAVVNWLEKRAFWRGTQKTDTDIPQEYKPEGF